MLMYFIIASTTLITSAAVGGGLFLLLLIVIAVLVVCCRMRKKISQENSNSDNVYEDIKVRTTTAPWRLTPRGPSIGWARRNAEPQKFYPKPS